MSDIVKRAKRHAKDILDPGYPYYGTPELVREMAAEIERLRLTKAEREAVERAADLIDNKTCGDSSTLRGLLDRLGVGERLKELNNE